MDPERLRAFLEDYRALCEKHQMLISGCGCCESPYIIDTQNLTEGQTTLDENLERLKASA